MILILNEKIIIFLQYAQLHHPPPIPKEMKKNSVNIIPSTKLEILFKRYKYIFKEKKIFVLETYVIDSVNLSVFVLWSKEIPASAFSLHGCALAAATGGHVARMILDPVVFELGEMLAT